MKHLLITVTAAAALFGWEASRIHRCQRNQRIVNVITDLGGEVGVEEGNFPDLPRIHMLPFIRESFPQFKGHITSIRIPRYTKDDPSIGDIDFRAMGLDTVDTLREVDLWGQRSIGDDAMQSLARNEGVTTLVLSETGITDEGIKHLALLQNLKELYLCDTDITDASMPYIAILPSLEHLDISGTRVTGKGLKLLYGKPFKEIRISADMPNCEFLSLEGIEQFKLFRKRFPALTTSVITGTNKEEE